MQIMPAVASGIEDPFEPSANLDVGARYFSGLLRRFDGDVQLALAAYNAGPSAVERFGGVPPYRETNRFVSRVMQIYANHSRGTELAVAEAQPTERAVLASR
jgi:soluble lytic murein transglycosylase-like protein